MDVEIARSRLQQMLVDLDDSNRTLVAEGEGTAELSRLDQHPAEAAAELTEHGRDDAMLAVVRSQREQVVAALARLDGGTYGSCVDCGATLPDERLDARPEAARCMTCQQNLETSE